MFLESSSLISPNEYLSRRHLCTLWWDHSCVTQPPHILQFVHRTGNTNLRGSSLNSWPPAYFVWILLLCSCWICNSFTCWIESKPFKQEVNCRVIFPPYGECSLGHQLKWLWSTLRSVKLEFHHRYFEEKYFFAKKCSAQLWSFHFVLFCPKQRCWQIGRLYFQHTTLPCPTFNKVDFIWYPLAGIFLKCWTVEKCKIKSDFKTALWIIVKRDQTEYIC